jgi:2-keto-4-pentenoate hydratase/2-oxohepta-3-ene-1,7-dioic acid hydratase in catechol pathway
VFLKASTSLSGRNEAIEIPEWVGRVDYEGELLVVLGKGGKNVSEADAMGLVCGYSLFNDVTARALQRDDQERKHPWFRSKSLDTFGPLGPYLVTADEIPDPHNLRLTLSVNGETKQDDTTASMVYSIPALIAFLSKHFRLEPGDVIATGTPVGHRAARSRRRGGSEHPGPGYAPQPGRGRRMRRAPRALLQTGKAVGQLGVLQKVLGVADLLQRFGVGRVHAQNFFELKQGGSVLPVLVQPVAQRERFARAGLTQQQADLGCGRAARLRLG